MNIKKRGQLTKRLEREAGNGRLRTATELAHVIKHSPATVSGILHRLVAQGRVFRIQSDVHAGPRVDLKSGTWCY